MKKLSFFAFLLLFQSTAHALPVKNNTEKNIVIVDDSYIKNGIINPNIKGKKIKPKLSSNVTPGKKYWVLYENKFYQFYFSKKITLKIKGINYSQIVVRYGIDVRDRIFLDHYSGGSKGSYNLQDINCPANISKKLLK